MSDRPRFHAERITNSLWVGLLTYRRSRLSGFRPSAFPGSPEWLMEGQFSCLQWRDRAGLAPASLLRPRGHPECLNSTIAQTDDRDTISRIGIRSIEAIARAKTGLQLEARVAKGSPRNVHSRLGPATEDRLATVTR